MRICIVFLFFLTACRPENIVIDLPEVDNPGDTTIIVEPHPAVVWQAPLSDDTVRLGSSRPVFLKNGLVVFQSSTASSSDKLYAFDLRNGEVNWIWENPNDRRIPGIGTCHAVGDNLIISDWTNTYNLNPYSGEIKWQTNSSGSFAPMSIIGDYLYDVTATSTHDHDEAFLMRTKVGILKMDTLFRLRQAENNYFEPNLMAPSLWESPAGDSILIFHSRDIDWANIDFKCPLYALDLATREIIWEIEMADPNGLGTLHPPLVHDDKIYFQGSQHVTCFDAATGSELWRSRPLTGHGNCYMVIAEDKLFVKPDGEDIHAFDLESGDIIWERSGREVPASSHNIVYYNGHIWTNGIPGNMSQLLAFNASTGEIAWTMDPPNRRINGNVGYSNLDGGIAIDTTLGYLYTCDGFFAQCIKLPDL